MRRLVVAGLLAAGALLTPATAHACTVETCWFTAPVCTQVRCEICVYQTGGGGRCYP